VRKLCTRYTHSRVVKYLSLSFLLKIPLVTSSTIHVCIHFLSSEYIISNTAFHSFFCLLYFWTSILLTCSITVLSSKKCEIPILAILFHCIIFWGKVLFLCRIELPVTTLYKENSVVCYRSHCIKSLSSQLFSEFFCMVAMNAKYFFRINLLYKLKNALSSSMSR